MRDLPRQTNFTKKSLDAPRVYGGPIRKKLERDELSDAEIVGAIHIAHAAATDEIRDPVAFVENFARCERDGGCRHRISRRLHHLRGNRGDRLLQEHFCAAEVRENGFDFLADFFIITEGFAQERLAVGMRPIQRRLTDFLDLTKPIGLIGHDLCPGNLHATNRDFVRVCAPKRQIRRYTGELRSAPSSRASHTFARRQSPMTGCGEAWSKFAVSSTLRPPKNRSSTTLARRGSTCASDVRASSRAHSISAGSDSALGSASRSMGDECSAHGAAPPRFRAVRTRAASMRIRRIIGAANAQK